MSTTVYISRVTPQVDSGSASITANMAVCSVSNSAATTKVTKATAAALANAHQVVGIALAAANPGDTVQLAYPGDIISNSVTGLGNGSVAFVTVNTTTALLQRATVLDGSEYVVGISDTKGNVTLSSEFGPLSSTGTHLVLNVKRFGATGDNATDDTTAIQTAIAACQNSLQSGVIGVGSGIYSGFTIYFPRGSYKVGGIDIPQFMTVKGDGNAIIWCSDATRSTLLVGSGYLIVDGLTIVGGRWAIQITGTSSYFGGYLGNKTTDSNAVTIRNCSIRGNSGGTTEVLIYLGGQASQNLGISGQILVENCDLQGPAFFWGSSDNTVFRDCFVTQSFVAGYTPPDNGYGLPLAMFTAGAAFTLDCVAITPNAGAYNHKLAVVEGLGHFRIINSRFGGESVCIPARFAAACTYNGFEIFKDPGGIGGGSVYFDKTGISCTGRNHLFEAIDQFPQKLVFEDCLVGIEGTDAYDAKDVDTLTAGIWIGTDIDLTKIQDRDNSLEIRFGFFSQNIAQRFYQSSLANRLDPTQYTDVTGYFRSVVRGTYYNDPNALAHQTGYQSSLPRNNLWFNGHIDWAALQSSSISGFTNPGSNTSTGYTLTEYQCTTAGHFDITGSGSDTVSAISITMHGGDGNGGKWGSGQAAGEYVFSMYFYASAPCTVQIALSYGSGKSRYTKPYIMPGGSLKRIWFPFYYDGTNQPAFVIGTDNSPPLGLLVYGGLMMINTGTEPAPYIVPNYGDPTNGHGTAENYVPTIEYGTAAPIAGTYKRGDMVINTTPTAGGTYAWVCTTAGSPGTFKAISIAA